jgi:4-amino-4-deoxy-L-arabinose transferase-like glycosyltransferase
MRARLEPVFNHKRFYPVAISAAIILYLALATGSALTYRPEIDEGYFASPAVNLLTTGSMGTPVVEVAGTGLKNINERTYWVMPLHILAQAAWYKVFGFSLLSMRTLSAAFGLLALAALFLIVKAVSRDRTTALLAMVLLAVDYMFVVASSLGRMDLMSAALGFAGLAAFLSLRERDLRWAILAGESFVVLSGMTHPNGIIHFVGMQFVILYFDRKRIGLRQVGFAALPFLVGALIWGAYVLKDPSAFYEQFVVNITMNNRMGGLHSPWAALGREFVWRYGRAFGLGPHSVGHSGPIYLKSIVLVAYAMALLGGLLTRELRRHRGYRALLILIAIYFVLLTVLDGQKETPYLMHIIPLYVAMLAVWTRWCWTRRLVPAPLIAAALLLVVAVQAGGMLFRIKQDTYHKLYAPAISFLKEHTGPATTINGSPSLGFELGFTDNLRTDGRLGYISGKRPDLIVITDENESSFEEYRTMNPPLYEHIERTLTQDYRQVYENPAFRVYARR